MSTAKRRIEEELETHCLDDRVEQGGRVGVIETDHLDGTYTVRWDDGGPKTRVYGHELTPDY